MPYKEAVIPLLDHLDPSAAVIDSVNTIVNDDGVLTGYNTDYLAVRLLLDHHAVDTNARFALLGAGGMAKAVLAALRDAGFRDGVVVTPRNLQRGEQLAARYGIRAVTDVGDTHPQLLVNATPIGMDGGPEHSQLAFPTDVIAAADSVFDVVYMPRDTPLVREAQRLDKQTITGDEVQLHQALEQFVLYTGVRPTVAQVDLAEQYATTR